MGRPEALRVLPENIPDDMKQLQRWVCWKYIQKDEDKWTKVPYNASNHRAASVTKNEDHVSYEQAYSSYLRKDYDGIGFVLDKATVDLDHVVENDLIDPKALSIIEQFQSYTEYSPSGTGIHIYTLGEIPSSGGRKGNTEIYQKDRYITVTGQLVDENLSKRVFVNGPLQDLWKTIAKEPSAKRVEYITLPQRSDEEVLHLARNAKNGAKFERLWSGWVDDSVTPSEADMALCAELAYWCRGDESQIDRLFRQSNLMRSKWDERRGAETYGDRTIRRIVSTGSYQAPQWVEVRDLTVDTIQTEREAPEQLDTIVCEPIVSKLEVINSDEIEYKFPTKSLLSPTLIKWVQQQSAAMCVSEDFAGASVLAACSGAMGNTELVRVEEDWEESCLLWISIVGEPGTLKTPTMVKAMEPIWTYQTQLDERFKETKQEYEEELEYYNKNKAKGADKPEAIYRKVIVINDFTTEALNAALSCNPRGVIVHVDELASWVDAFNVYKNGSGADKSTWLSLWSAHHKSILRKTNDYAVLLKRPFASVFGGVQPSKLTEILNASGVEDGFNERMLFCFPEEQRRIRTRSNKLDSKLKLEYEVFIKKLLMREPKYADGKLLAAHLSSEADSVHFDKCVALDRELFSMERYIGHRKAFVKMDIQAARIINILHKVCIAEGIAKEGLVEKEVVIAAWEIVEYFKYMTKKVHRLKSITQEDTDTEHLVKWIRDKGGTATARDILTSHVCGFKKNTIVEDALRNLEDRGIGKRVIEKVKGGTRVTFELS